MQVLAEWERVSPSALGEVKRGVRAEEESGGHAKAERIRDGHAANREKMARPCPENATNEVVEMYGPDRLVVEFLRHSGHTHAVVTLREPDVRPVDDRDVNAVRRLGRSA